MHKRILTILLLALALSIFASAAEISSADDMLTLMNTPSMWADSYTLTTDIDLSKATNGLSQAAIGNATTPFKGNFDGAGHTISGINISGANHVGLFGNVGGGGTVTIKNLTVFGAVSGADNVGGIIGVVDETSVTVQNCINNCTLSGSNYLGGIVGKLSISSETVLISECRNNGTVTASTSYSGGIVGFSANSKGKTTIEKCLNTGAVTIKTAGAAGIVAYWRVYADAECTVQDCVNTGVITAGTSGYAGGIIANGANQNNPYTITRCFNTGSISATKVYYVRPIAARPASTAVSGITNCYYTSTDTYTAAATDAVVYVADATVAANVVGLGDAFVLVDGYTPELKAFHEHSTDGDYVITETKHEKICYCGEVAVSGAHTFDGGKCTVCGAGEQFCAHENKYEVIETAATCVAVGSKYEYCPDCEMKVGASTEIPVDAANHSGALTMEFANGEVTYTCTACSNVAYTDSTLLTTVYVSENANGLFGKVTAQIGSEANPFKNFTDAMQYAAYNTKDVTVVILDSASTPEIYETPEFAHTVTVKGGTLCTAARFIMNGPMAFEDICFSDSDNPFIVAQEHKIVMGEGITVSGGGIYLVGGYESGSATASDIPATGFNADITVRSGVYALISGAHRRVSRTYAGDIHMVIGKTNDADVLEITNFVSASTTYDGANGVNVTVIIDGAVDEITKFYPVSYAADAGRIDVDFAICGALLSGASKVTISGSDYALNVYSDSRVDGADEFAAAIVGAENVQPYSRFCMKVNGEHPDANADGLCDNCGTVTACAHEEGEWTLVSEATCFSTAKYTWYCYDCIALVEEITKEGDIDASNHISDSFVWAYDGDKYVLVCPACENVIAESDAPVVYVSANGNDGYDGTDAEKAVATLTEAVRRIANSGGTVVICGTYPLESTVLPAYTKPITIKGSDPVDSFRRGGFQISAKTHLALSGETVLDNLLFDGDATYIISCNWNDVTFKSIEAINNATSYVLLGKYNIKENDDTADSATLTITEGAWVSDHISNTATLTRFYSRIYLGDTFSSAESANGVSVSNKTATLNATDADIGTLYTMSTSDNYANNPIVNCETTVNLYGRTRVNEGRTGDKNVNQADSTASLTKQTVNFFDNSFIGADYDIINAENTVIYVSGSKDGRVVPMNIGFTFYSFGNFATALTPMNVELNYSTHSFAETLSSPVSFVENAEAQKVLTENKTDECEFGAKVTVAATPDTNGTKLYSCACGRSYTEEYAYSCADAAHFYIANADGSFTCTVCSENFNSVDGENVFAVSSAVVENGVVTITATVNGNFAAAFVNVSLPSGFTFVNATLPTVEGFVCDGNADGGVYSIVLMSNTTEKESVNTEIKLEYAFDSGIEAAGALVEITVPEIYGSDMEKLVATTVCAFTAKNSCEHFTTEDVVTLSPTCTATGLKNVVCADCKTVVRAEVVVEIDSSNHADYVCVSTESGMICNGCKAEIEVPSAPVLIFATPNSNANGTIEVTVSVKATTPITATRFRVDAPEGFTLLFAESLLDGSDFTLLVQDDTVLPYNVAIINTAIKDATINAAVIKLTFATDGIEDNSECLVSVTAEETYNLYCEAIDTATVGASVTVTEYKGVIGDIDGDERVTVLDALMLIRAIVNSKTIANGDVNGDGKVGLADAIRIMKLITQ